jgi:iron complex outermembrane recepter protein
MWNRELGSYDDSGQGRGGFRVDFGGADSPDTFTLQGDFYRGRTGMFHHVLQPPPDGNFSTRAYDNVAGANVLGRWTHHSIDESVWTLQGYYDRAERQSLVMGHVVETFDVDLVHHRPGYGNHALTWGMNYRHVRDDIDNTIPSFLSLTPDRRNTNYIGLFIQDDISLVEDDLIFTIGTKLEHNDFTGWEVQPNARLTWAIDDRNVAWGAVSRALRVTSRAEDDLHIKIAQIAA